MSKFVQIRSVLDETNGFNEVEYDLFLPLRARGCVLRRRPKKTCV